MIFLCVSLLVLFISSCFIYHNSVHYKTYPLKVNTKKFPHLNENVEMDSLVQSFISQMTLKDKVSQLYGEKPFRFYPKFLINFFIKKRFPHVYVGRNKQLGIPPWVLSDGPRGARVMRSDIKAVTTFPVAMARGASWDVDLEYRINDVIAKEMRANQTNYAATPCINLLRHPAWGRAQETYGEDPWLLGEFGLAAVKAIEQNNVMACPKHFALNSIENSRWVVNVELEERALREVYLPHFKKVIQEGQPASLMSAYNQFRGEHCGSNHELLTQILREEWGFEGFVSTDWIYGLYDGIGGVQAGLDVEMPVQNAYAYKTIKKGIENGEITEKQIDQLVERILKTRLKYAIIQDDDQFPKELILSKEHIVLAREAAEKSMVLIKNENVLPFTQNSNKKIAVIGRLADLEQTGDHGSSNCTPPYVITPYQGLVNFHQQLGNEVIYNDGTNLAEAKQLATEADEVIIVVGYTFKEEGEYIIMNKNKMKASAEAGKLVGKKGTGGDREDLKLLAEDEALILALADKNEKTVVVYSGGSAIDLSNWHDEVPAILFSWYAGMEGGNALAHLLYGTRNPSGKLPFSIARKSGDYPYFNAFTKEITYGYYHGYTLFEKEKKEVLYPFGHGLSYTEFEYSNLKTNSGIIHPDSTLKIQVDIRNTGEVQGAEIVQLYIGFSESEVDRPIKLLRAFDKITLEPQASKTVFFDIHPRDLAWYNPKQKAWEIEMMTYELFVGGSSRNNDLLQSSFEIRE